MMRITSQLQAVRIAELLTALGDAHHFELGNTLQTEELTVHLKEYRMDGSVHNYFIEAQGHVWMGAVGTWFVIPASNP